MADVLRTATVQATDVATGAPSTELSSGLTGSPRADRAPAALIDGNAATRWSSDWNHAQVHVTFTLAELSDLTDFFVDWEHSHALLWRLATSPDASGDTFTEVGPDFTSPAGEPERRVLLTAKSVRRLRFTCLTKREPQWGCSAWAMTSEGTPAASGPPDWQQRYNDEVAAHNATKAIRDDYRRRLDQIKPLATV